MSTQKNSFSLFKFRVSFLGMVLFSQLATAQLMEMDFTTQKREENNFRFHLLRFGMVGLSSLQHVDVTAEVLKFRYDTKAGLYWGFTVFGTNTLWRGNKVDALNTFDFLMNPIGGTIHGNLLTRIPLKRYPTKNSNLGLSMGTKWIQGPPLPNFKNSSFFDHYLRLGWIHQRLLAEDPLQNTSLSFWAFPYVQLHQSSLESRKYFFSDQIDPLAAGYGVELGLAYNAQLKITLHGQQLLSTDPQGDFRRFVTRLIVAYRF